MKKQPPRRPPLPTALRNLNHRAPVTRREFMGRGLMSTTATVVGMGSFFSMFANPRKAYATLASDIQALVTSPCNIRAGAGKIPVIVFDLAGGGNIAGSNALVGGTGGPLDFLSTAGYNKLGLPGNMIPNASSGPGNFINTSMGIPMHSDSAYLRGIQARASASTLANMGGAVIPSISQTDTNLNQQNPIYGFHAYGAAGSLLALIGTQATASGGNSMAPAYMVDPTVNPTVVTQPSDVTGLISTGQLVQLLDQADAVNVLESVERISAAKLGQVTTGLPNAQDAAIKQLVQCSYVDAAYLVDKYGNAITTLDPRQDAIITGGSDSIFTATDLQNSDFLATASVMKMIVNGYAGAATIEMGGFDYHDSTRATGETRDFMAGQAMGACLEYAARVGVPLMICVISDGSLVSNGVPDESPAGRGKGAWMADNTATAAALMLYFDPKGPVQMNMTQIGNYNSDGTVNATGSAAANSVNLLAETMILNYMALHGQAGAYQSLTFGPSAQPSGLGAAASSVIAFNQGASVSNGQVQTS
jgi:hypothetical protein